MLHDVLLNCTPIIVFKCDALLNYLVTLCQQNLHLSIVHEHALHFIC